MSGLNMGIIKSMPIVMPPIEFQRTYAERVAAVDVLKAKCRESLVELDSLLAALQYRAFRGELTA